MGDIFDQALEGNAPSGGDIFDLALADPATPHSEARALGNSAVKGVGSLLSLVQNLSPVKLPDLQDSGYSVLGVPLPEQKDPNAFTVFGMQPTIPPLFGLSDYLKNRFAPTTLTDLVTEGAQPKQEPFNQTFNRVASDSGLLTADKPQTESGKLAGNILEQAIPSALFGPGAAVVGGISGGTGSYIGEKYLPGLFGIQPTTANAVGGVAGGVLPGLGGLLASTGKRLLGPLTQGGREAAIGELLRDSVTGGKIQEAKDTLGAFDAAAAPFNEFKTTAEIAGDPGLARLEDAGRGFVPSESIVAADDARTAARLDSAESMFNPDVSITTSSKQAVSKVQDAYKAVKKLENDAWENIPSKEEIVFDSQHADAIKQTVLDVYDNLELAPGELQGLVGKVDKLAAAPATFNTIKQLRSRVGELKASPDPSVRRIAGQVEDQLMGVIQENADAGFLSPDTTAALQNALEVSTLKHQTFRATDALEAASGLKRKKLLDASFLTQTLNSPDKLKATLAAANTGGTSIENEVKNALLQQVTTRGGKEISQIQWPREFARRKEQLALALSPDEMSNLQAVMDDIEAQSGRVKDAFKANQGQSATTPRREVTDRIRSAKGLADPQTAERTLGGLGGATGAGLGWATGGLFNASIGSGVLAPAGAKLGQVLATNPSGEFDQLLIQALKDPETALKLMNTNRPWVEGIEQAGALGNKAMLQTGPRAAIRGITGEHPTLFSPTITDKNSEKEKPGGPTMTDTPKKTLAVPDVISANRVDAPTKQTAHLGGVPIDAALDAIRQIESGGGKYLVSPKGALGPYQFIPSTAKAYGLEDPMDETKSRATAGRMIGDLYKQFKDLDLTLVAYNWGSGNLTDLIKLAKTRDFDKLAPLLPSEARNYVHRFHAVLPHFLDDTAVA